MSKIGLGIVTCNREDFYDKCLECVPSNKVDWLVTVNDGDELKAPPSKGSYLHHEVNKGVGVSKNDAMRFLLDSGCEHIFLIEDDILITDENVFQKYIDVAAASGLQHLMFGYHGPANKNPTTKEPMPRLIVQYSNEHSVAFNQHCVGAFCYYHKSVLDKVGLMDEKYVNAWEHVDHSYSIVKEGFIPGYWWWPDVADSYKYLDEQACSEDNSAIRPRSDWKLNIETGAKHFVSKHNVLPVTVPDQTSHQITTKLKDIKKNVRS